MSNEIELISDGDGLAVIGDPAAVERFLSAEQLPAKELPLPRLSKALAAGAGGLQVSADLAEKAGRWVKLTPESAAKVKKYGLMPSKNPPGVSHAMIGQPGDVQSWIQIAKGPGAIAANPAVLAGGAGIMAQLAMQQTMAEITDYLARIDEKLDDVLRGQKDAVVSQMVGVGLQIEEAMTLRGHVGRVNEVMWSKIQATSGAMADTQAYALLQLDALAEKLEAKDKIGELASATKEAAPKVREWLAVLARCFQLLDGIAVLELDRVLETSPDDLNGYRNGLKAARRERRAAIEQCTARLLARLEAAASLANEKVLFHPAASPEIVHASDRTADALAHFHELLGIETGRQGVEARRWASAAAEARERAVASGGDGVDAAKRLGVETRDRAKSATAKVSTRLAERSQRWRARQAEQDQDD